MDSIILVAALVSFLALIGSWLALPSSHETSRVVVHGSVVHGSAVRV